MQELLSACQDAILPPVSTIGTSHLALPAPPTPSVTTSTAGGKSTTSRRGSRATKCTHPEEGGEDDDSDFSTGQVVQASDIDETGSAGTIGDESGLTKSTGITDAEACLHCGAPRDGPELCADCRADQCQICGKVDPISIDAQLRCFGCVREHLLRARMRIGALRPHVPFLPTSLFAHDMQQQSRGGFGAGPPMSRLSTQSCSSTIALSSFAPPLPPSLYSLHGQDAEEADASEAKPSDVMYDGPPFADVPTAAAVRPAAKNKLMPPPPNRIPSPASTSKSSPLSRGLAVPFLLPGSHDSFSLDQAQSSPILKSFSASPLLKSATKQSSSPLLKSVKSPLPPLLSLDTASNVSLTDSNGSFDVPFSSEWERPLTNEELSFLLASPMRPATPGHAPPPYTAPTGRNLTPPNEGLLNTSPQSPNFVRSASPKLMGVMPPLTPSGACAIDETNNSTAPTPPSASPSRVCSDANFSLLRPISPAQNSPLRLYSPRRNFPVMALLQPPENNNHHAGSVNGSPASASDIANFVARGEQRALAEWAISTARHASPYVGIPQSPLRIPQSPMHGGTSRLIAPSAANLQTDKGRSCFSEHVTALQLKSTITPSSIVNLEANSILRRSPCLTATGGQTVTGASPLHSQGSSFPPTTRRRRSNSLDTGPPHPKRQRSASDMETDMTEWLDPDAESFGLDPNQYGSNLGK